VISSGANTAYDAWIGGGLNNVITSDGEFAAINGGVGNVINAQYAAVGGGYENTIALQGESAAVAGGYNNNASAEYTSVGGGSTNTASAEYANVSGGSMNTASGEWTTVAGGNTNTASGNGANVAGGANNVASGPHATVLGGSRNTASGPQSLAAGFNSNAATAGAFVWSDDAADATQLTSTAANQFLARASGGFTLWTNATNTVGATLAPGSGAWASTSDRNMKTDIRGLDDAKVLDRVGSLPIGTWSYVTERGVRHVGPMAQDFYAAFGVGEDDRHITSIDEDGVALAAIKALHGQLRSQSKSARSAIATLRAENAQLRAASASQSAKIAAVETQLQRLSAQMGRLTR